MQAMGELLYFLTAPILLEIVTLLCFKCQHPAILAHVILLLRHCGPGLITLLGQRAPSCAIWCAIGPYQKHCIVDNDV